MPTANTPTERAECLGRWLSEAVRLLLEAGGGVARALVETCGDREATIRIDDVVLALHAERRDGGIHLDVRVPAGHPPCEFETDAATLRAIIAGDILLDTAIVDDRLRVRAPLADLLAMHDLVQKALACGPIDPRLRTLWAAFDGGWPGNDPAQRCMPLEGQRPGHGTLRRTVPSDVLQVRLKGPSELI